MMDALAWISGIIGLMFILAYLMFKLAKQQLVLKVAFILMLFALNLMIAKVMLDDTDNCQVIVRNATVSGSTTEYQYEEECFTNSNETSTIYYTVSMILLMVVYSYFFLSFFYWIFVHFIGFMGKLGKIYRRKKRK